MVCRGRAQDRAPTAPRLALVIGNANYTTLGRLANPGQDAQLMAEKLKALGFDVTEKRDRGLKENLTMSSSFRERSATAARPRSPYSIMPATGSRATE